MKKLYLVFVIVFAKFSSSSAQDQTNFTQFYLNPYLINPSYAGLDGQSSMSLMYKRQWINIDGAPIITNFSLHTPVNEKLSAGLSVTNDKKAFFSNSALLLSLAYNLPINDYSFVRFGLSGGGTWNTVDLQRVESNDPALASVLNNHASLAGNAGISLHSKFFHAGISMPTIFSPSYISTDAFGIKEVQPFQALILHASNRFYFNNNKNVFEPYAVYRLNAEMPSQYEIAGLLHLNHTIWVGGSYKEDFGISALGGIKLKNTLAIGGGYTFKNSGINELNSASFEVSLSYLFGQHKKGTHLYSFVNTSKEKIKHHKKKPVQQHQSASEALAATRKTNQPFKKATPPPRQETVVAKNNQQKQSTPTNPKTTPAKNNTQPIVKETAIAQNTKPVQQNQSGTKEANASTPKQNTTKPVQQQGQVASNNSSTPKQTLPAQEKPSIPVKETPVANQPKNNTQQQPAAKPVVDEGHHEHEQEQISRLAHEDPTEHHGEDHHPHAERHEFHKRGDHQEELDVADYVVGGVFKSDVNAKHFVEGLKKLGFKNADYGHLTVKNLWYVYIIQTDNLEDAKAERDPGEKDESIKGLLAINSTSLAIWHSPIG